MDKHEVLQKKDFNAFIRELTAMQKLVAPVSLGNNQYAFRDVTNGDEIADTYIPTILPPKKYFMPQKETIVSFNKEKQAWTPVVDSEDITVFGVRTCDLAGIQSLNMVFKDDPQDINYTTRGNKVTIIGFECNDYCDEYASCAVMDTHFPNGGYDLFMTDLGDCFLIHVNSAAGDKIVSNSKVTKEANDTHLNRLKALHDKKRGIFKDEVKVKHRELKALFEKSFDHPVWDKLNDTCLACGNCTNVCPTCYCFDIKDDINLDLNTGVRVRVWDSCQTEPFAKVAGDENFRESRKERQKHRYMRKFNYPVDKYSRYFCTGCGRCSRTCMAKINLKETIDALEAVV